MSAQPKVSFLSFSLSSTRENLLETLTFTVVAEGHPGLAETNGVLASGDAIELLELGLVDALHKKKLGMYT